MEEVGVLSYSTHVRGRFTPPRHVTAGVSFLHVLVSSHFQHFMPPKAAASGTPFAEKAVFHGAPRTG